MSIGGARGAQLCGLWPAMWPMGSAMWPRWMAFFIEANNCRTRAGAKGDQGGLPPLIDMLGPPINELTLLKRMVFVLNFKLWPPWLTLGSPKSTALVPALYRTIEVIMLTYYQITEPNNCEKQSLSQNFHAIIGCKFFLWITERQLQCNR